MAKTVGNVATAARYLLQDETPVRWTDTEVIGWVNDGQREIVALKPDANAVRTDFACAAGAYQTLPSDGVRLLDVVRNVGGPRIRRVDRYIMDIEAPDWHEATASATTDHYIFEEEVPDAFYLYPPRPASTPGSVVIVYSALPTEATILADSLTLDDEYFNPLVDYVAYRCFMKDSEFDNQAARADAHYTAFMQGIGLKSAGEDESNPNRSA